MQKPTAKFYTVSTVIAVLAVLIGLLFAHKIQRGSSDETSSLSVAHRIEPAVTTHAEGPADKHNANVRRGKEASGAESANAVFFDSPTSRVDRFKALSELAAKGDKNAVYFQFQMMAACDTASRALADKSILNNAKPELRGYFSLALTHMNAGCADLVDSPNYIDFKRSFSSDAATLNAETSVKIKEAFADGGLDALNKSVIATLRERADENTISTIVDTYSDLSSLDTLIGSDLKGVYAAPMKKKELATYALNLLACDYGRDCGPESDTVSLYCLTYGACKPGMNLEQLYSSDVLSGTDFDQVRAIVSRLRGN